ncbi:UDP-glucose 4-epimerase GalE [Microbacterium pseudoresistens]|uniref:UDP-glucose 4-epimerase n=1 Tax=Microbacterium pseudoresistens TaxID=640634 RepID=A0A7Y9EV89_9MICO|nr:UDP-glucose 4-epimerase GalE [Microbacterium pseudoresistens]NYD54598.1 UDP-glucose 4-epimerase [Microbacterium pseudoresistens]
MRVLLTGGAGYIGSHTAVVLLEAGHDVVLLDDFSNSSPQVIARVEKLAQRPVDSIRCDIADLAAAERALDGLDFDAVIHLAGLKSVGESVAQPSVYYRTNIVSTLNILDIMRAKNVRKFVFSSSATVYGASESQRIDEQHPVGHGLTNPYGWSKAMNEQIIRDVGHAQPDLEVALLRYFNPVGAHESGRIGEKPSGVPNNLMPYVAEVASGVREHVNVFGDRYPTPDGTGVRDYIHVMDLARGHLAALEHLSPGVEVFNLGTGVGHSVLEVIRAFADASGREIPYVIAEPRAGDVATAVADPSKANRELGWHAQLDLDDACRDAWRWQAGVAAGV